MKTSSYVKYVKNVKKKAWFIFFHTMFFFWCCFLHGSCAQFNRLVVGLDPNFPPMGYVDEGGKTIGSDIDMLNLIGKTLGVSFVFQPINWDAKELELNNGNVDLLCNGLSYTPEREKTMLLTKPYMENGQVVVVKKGSAVKKLEQLKGCAICLQKGSSGEDAFEKSTLSSKVKSVVKLENCVDCLNEVRQSKVDAAIVDEAVARFYLNKEANSNDFTVLDEPIAGEFYVIAVKKGNFELKNLLEQAFDKIANLKETQQISEKWFGKQMFNFKTLQATSDQHDSNKQSKMFENLFSGFLVTLEVFAFCLMFSMPLGLVICFLKNLKSVVLKSVINFYIALMRGTPLLMQLFFAFYALPILFPSLVLKNRLFIGILVFILNYAAYFTEIFRSGLISISKGQFEAIEVLQIPKFKAMFRIIMPQMFKVCLPSICNETITLVKDTSLIFSIGVVELLTAAKNLVNSTADVSIYGIVAAIYFLFCYVLNLVFKLIEKKLKFD